MHRAQANLLSDLQRCIGIGCSQQGMQVITCSVSAIRIGTRLPPHRLQAMLAGAITNRLFAPVEKCWSAQLQRQLLHCGPFWHQGNWRQQGCEVWVPRVATERACVSPRVNRELPCVQGRTLAREVTRRTPSRLRPSGRRPCSLAFCRKTSDTTACACPSIFPFQALLK